MDGKKHVNGGKRRVLRRLYLDIDTYTHEIIAAKLSLLNVSDDEELPNLLKQTRRRILDKPGDDGAYDTRLCYEGINIKRATPLILQGEVAAFCEQCHPRNFVRSTQTGHLIKRHFAVQS